MQFKYRMSGQRSLIEPQWADVGAHFTLLTQEPVDLRMRWEALVGSAVAVLLFCFCASWDETPLVTWYNCPGRSWLASEAYISV